MSKLPIPPDVCLLVAHHGIGDHYIVAGLAEAFSRHYRLRVWMAGRPDMAFLPQVFPAVGRYFSWPAEQDPSCHGHWEVMGGEMYYAHFHKLDLMRAVGYNGFHFLDAYRCRLGLPPTAQLSRGVPSTPEELASAQSTLAARGMRPGRTVLLSIEARSTPTGGIDFAFWDELARELASRGLDTVINAGPTTPLPPGLPAIAAPIRELRALAETAGHVCTVRSGLSDLFCDLPCRQVVVYPDVRYWAGTLIEGTTFSRFGLGPGPQEVVVERGEGLAKARIAAEAVAPALPARNAA